MNEYIVRIADDMPYEIKAELNAWYIESEPIVRCRDCRYYSEYQDLYERLHPGMLVMDADGFCAWGEMAENTIIGESYKQPSENDGEVIKNGGQYKFDGEAHTAAYAPYPLSVKANNPQGEVFVTGTTFEHDTREPVFSDGCRDPEVTGGWPDEFDTREKLEADVHQFANPSGRVDNIGAHLEKRMLGFLDRQAEITKREEILSYECTAERQSDRIFELHNKLADAQEDIVKLTTERDELRERLQRTDKSLSAMGILRLNAQIAELTAERDQLSRDLTAEHALLRQFEHDNEQLREHAADLTADAKRWADAANEQRLVAMEQADKVQELTVERDELREAIDAMENGQFYAMYRRACEERDALKHDREKVWCDCDCCGWQAEREQMQRVIDTQRESFRKTEFDLAQAKGNRVGG